MHGLSNAFTVAQELWINAFLKLLLYLLTRKLHCTRNYIHMNLFVSFILRAMAVISKEIILYVMYSNLPKDDPGWNSYSSSSVYSIRILANYWLLLLNCNCSEFTRLIHPKHIPQQIALMCKFSKVAMEYFVACNYFWLLVEAIFLHTLLFTAVLTKRCLLKKYMLLGWGRSVMNCLCVFICMLRYCEVVFTLFW